jgi:signal transduction histidine kinase/FixJ family two-component response regulator
VVALDSYCVVYVGSDSNISHALEDVFKGAGLPFASVLYDPQGMEMARALDPDILLWDLDNSVPGDRIPKAELARVGLSRQPVVAVVKSDDVRGALSSLADGAADFIYKPLSENPLARLSGVLDVRQKQFQLNGHQPVIEDATDQVRSILTTLVDPAYLVNANYQILWMNRAAEEIFGEGKKGGICHFVFYDRAEPCKVCAGNEGSARWRAVLKDGKSYRFTSVVIKNSRGDLERLAVGTDVTPGEEVRKIHKTFISNVSHDLRTPLAAIDQYLNILTDGLAGELTDEQKKYVEVIRRSSFRLNNLIENLIDANKILSGELKLRMEVANIEDIFNFVIERLSSQAAEKGISLEVQIAEGLPPVYADKARISQVVANVVGNSIKFTEQGAIQVRAGFMPRDQGRVIVSVEDTGIGIPKEDLGKIFDLFYRVEQDKVYVEEGAGLGLSISREIIRAHGGTLWTESMEGMGSAFHFAIPAYVGRAADGVAGGL